MRKHYLLLFIILLLSWQCRQPKYFHDTESSQRQTEIRKNHTGNVFAAAGVMLASVFLSSVVAIDVFPLNEEFEKMHLINSAADTMRVNMLTNVYRDTYDYCDFMDIRIPPGKTCKLYVPVNADYNLYFSTTVDSNDDEMITINTGELKKISLYPGLTTPDESKNNNLNN